MRLRTEEFIPSREGTVGVLTVSSLPPDLIHLRQILSGSDWNVQEASNCREALALLRTRGVQVVLCERDQPDGDWKDLLLATATMPAPPSVVVFSRLADEFLWAEVLNLGGFDVLMTPFEAEEVWRVTSAACRNSELDFVRGPAREAECDEAFAS